MKTRVLALALTALCAVAAFTTLPSTATAQEQRLTLKPDGTIEQPLTFLPKNGVHVSLPAIAVTATATGTTNGFKIPFGVVTDPTYSGGLPSPGAATTLHFFVTSVQVEYVTLTGATGAAVVNVGSTGTATNSIVASGSLSNTATAPCIIPLTVASGGTNKPLASGDTITVNVGTAYAGATAASVKVHVNGYYQ